MDDDLARALGDLADAVAALGDALETTSRPRLTTPRPADVLRATDEVAIPTLIAVLEAQIRMLKLLQRGTRLFRYDQAIRDQAASGGADGRIGGRDRSEALLSQLDQTLARLRGRVDSDDERVQATLERTQSMYDDLERALLGDSNAEHSRSNGRQTAGDSRQPGAGFEIDIDDESGTGTDGTSGSPDDSSADVTAEGVDVDVDAELETLRDRYGTETESSPSSSAESDDPTTDVGANGDDATEPDGDDTTEPDGDDATRDETDDPSRTDSDDTVGASDSSASSDTSEPTESGTDALDDSDDDTTDESGT